MYVIDTPKALEAFWVMFGIRMYTLVLRYIS